MGQSMFPAKTLFWIIAAFTLLGFATGYLHLYRGGQKCRSSKQWEFGQWHTWLSISSLEFRYRTVDYTCERYDPKTERVSPVPDVNRYDVPLDETQ